ncbi:AAA family ATPase [Myxococcus qinghaiensis]|uniref:AAA family ATPase n=1 Tax=Myxococcus qinghaiensis TaxID=2906758 RepID=UPI0020A746EE|nr:AAA family ATPase [Myxococcus qinghaiensis]MCP3166842.1 AAA family ATPase [Myxococcus qinghaiensis]
MSFKVSGASPVFKSDISREVTAGVNFILGGNGLGKTTTIQAIAYALSGGITKQFEPDRSFRWNHKWFSGRIDPEKASSAFVEIEFHLGQRRIGIRRHFSSSSVSAVKLTDSDEWITDRKKAASVLASELETAGFRSIDDFAFVVHRLLYLAEDRRAIAWDASAQVRLLMLLSPEAISEEQFRKSRENLKKVDSSRRHAHVAVGKLQGMLGQKVERLKPSASEVPPIAPGPDEQDESGTSAIDVLEALERAIGARTVAENTLQDLDRQLAQRSHDVEQLRTKIDAAEVALVQESLGEIETERRLPLAKLLERGLCPACGSHSAELQRLAHKHANDSQCLVCGTMEESGDWQELSSLQSQLSEKLRAQRVLDDRRRATKGQLQLAQREEDRLSLQVTSRALKSPARIEPLPSLNDGKIRPRPAELRQRLDDAQETEAQLLSEVKTYQNRLTRTYSRFKTNADQLRARRIILPRPHSRRRSRGKRSIRVFALCG